MHGSFAVLYFSLDFNGSRNLQDPHLAVVVVTAIKLFRYITLGSLSARMNHTCSSEIEKML